MSDHIRMHISFPKSCEDHRIRLVEINGSIFAIVFAPLESEGPIRLNCEEWSLVLLAPLKSKTNILVSAINLLCLSEIESKEGIVNLHASNRLVRFSPMDDQVGKLCQLGEAGESLLDEDSGALLYYYQLFEEIVTQVHVDTPESFADAQQKFITALCALAQKIEGDAEPLSLEKVLATWKIPLGLLNLSH